MISVKNLYKEFKNDNEIKKIKGAPIAGYDTERRLAFLEYPDGRRKYAKE